MISLALVELATATVADRHACRVALASVKVCSGTLHLAERCQKDSEISKGSLKLVRGCQAGGLMALCFVSRQYSSYGVLGCSASLHS
jgi:hypothetical protein